VARRDPLRIDVDWHRLERELLDGVDKGQKILDMQVLKDTEPYVPRDDGKLVGSGVRGTKIGSGEVVYDSPYAKKQYYTMRNKARDVHPLATMRWFESAKSTRKQVWLRLIKRTAGR